MMVLHDPVRLNLWLEGWQSFVNIDTQSLAAVSVSLLL